jgi:hypothetical protein
MMLANFILILIGLALLSMCINLIQTAIEHLLKGLLQQYMEEFEKIAAIVAEEEEEVRPFETGILSESDYDITSVPVCTMNLFSPLCTRWQVSFSKIKLHFSNITCTYCK